MFDPRGCVECESDYGRCSIHGKVELAVVSEIMLLIASGGSSNFQNRVSHSLAVGHRMRELSEYAGPVSPAAVDVAHALGNLHDIGYFNPITGMHAYDGALMVSNSGWGFLANDIAWHSTAEWEYAERVSQVLISISLLAEACYGLQILQLVLLVTDVLQPSGYLGY